MYIGRVLAKSMIMSRKPVVLTSDHKHPIPASHNTHANRRHKVLAHQPPTPTHLPTLNAQRPTVSSTSSRVPPLYPASSKHPHPGAAPKPIRRTGTYHSRSYTTRRISALPIHSHSLQRREGGDSPVVVVNPRAEPGRHPRRGTVLHPCWRGRILDGMFVGGGRLCLFV